MKCLDCQNDLVRLPTTQGPDLDVCPSGHGLWLDAGEVNCFVENYLSLKQAVGNGGGVATRTETRCPRCAIQLDSETVAEATIRSCSFCHGWWLSRGCLTHLNETYTGAAVTIRIDEQELYARASTRMSAPPHTPPALLKSGRNNPGNLWFWSLFFVLALVMGGIIFIAGIQKTIHTTRWSQPPDGFLFYLIMGMVGGLGLIWHGWTVQQRKRLIECIPTSPIRSLALGLVEIHGRAEPEAELLTSPFGGLPCVFYAYTVEEQIRSGKHTRWKTIANGTSEQPFFVRDTTGRVLVVPLGANLMLPDERSTRTSWLGELPPLAASGLSRLGITAHGWMGDKTLRCRESFILPDESIYVLGTALEHHGMGHHTANESRLYIGSSRDHAFILSDRSEKDLLSRLTWEMWAGFIGGPVLATTSAAIIWDRYFTTVTR
ncbi:MAG TPA: GIDE domain-containing protein [Nitrospira sp.]|nr:GIDE domain-containing protein [Nitrospira sp.]